MEIPKSKYNVGDRVIVRCEETPNFAATVSGVRWEGRINHINQHWYEITEEETGVSDGYTDEWLSPLNSVFSNIPAASKTDQTEQ